MSNKVNIFTITIINLLVFQSPLIIAEEDNPQNTINSSKAMVNDYLEKGTANQLNKNLDAIDKYYETINAKVKKNTHEKPAVEKKQEQGFSKDEKQKKEINDGLLEMMKTAGVDKSTETADSKTKKEPVVHIFRDPFSLTPSLTGGERLIEDSLPFAQKSFSGELPKMVLKGVVKKVDGTRVALIQLDDKLTYMVKENDRISLAALGIRTIIHVQEIHENAIIVEPGEINSGQENEVIVVR